MRRERRARKIAPTRGNCKPTSFREGRPAISRRFVLGWRGGGHANTFGPALAERFHFIEPLENYAGRRKPMDAARHVGGKAARLAWLARNGFRVPVTWVIGGAPFREHLEATLPPGHDPASLLRLGNGQVMLTRAAQARERLLNEPLDPGFADELGVLWETLAPEAPWGLAVRSSATCEDEDVTSMAGLAETVLAVRGGEALADAVRRVWASALLPRALAYLAARGIRDLAMGVVIQPVVPAEAGGVAFTRPPHGLETYGEGEMLVNITPGLGVPVVEGASTPDVARIDRATGEVVEYTVAEKQRVLVIDESGLREVALDAAKARARVADAALLAELSSIARKLDELQPGMPFDIEFVVAKGQVHLVQARPAAGSGFPEGGGADTVWSRANVGEALPGAATPLTWSIAQAFSERGFRRAFSSLGCTVPRGAKLVANVHGRFYLNFTAFMRIAAQVPGLDPRSLVELAGGAGVEVLEKQVADVSRRGFYARLPFTATRLLSEQMRLEGEVDRFETRAERALSAIREIDLTILPDDALATTLRDVRRLLDETGTLMLSCASASLASHLALKTVLARFAPVGAERIAQTLSAGIGDLESARPGIALSHVAAIARHDEPARIALDGGGKSPGELPDGPTKRALLQFLDTYGDRAVREAELSTPRWREDPAPLMAMLRSALRGPDNDPEAALARARRLADAELEALDAKLSVVESMLVRTLVSRSRRFHRLRERMRAWVTRVLGMIRTVALDVDRRLVRLEPSVGAGAAFFCTFDELVTTLVIGRADLGHLVRLRRAEHARDTARPDPPATFVGRPAPVVLPPVSAFVLRGLPASGGAVEGRARVLGPGGAGAEDLVAGEILIARTTDVGLSPLFLVAAGVVTELGGPLSHAALVAREYGVPAVVNAVGATTAIRTGDLVRVDGNRGVVERIEREDG